MCQAHASGLARKRSSVSSFQMIFEFFIAANIEAGHAAGEPAEQAAMTRPDAVVGSAWQARQRS